MNSENTYPTSSKLLHWTMAILLLSMLFLGLSMVQSLATWQIEAVKLHKSFGVLALILLILRLVNRSLTSAPVLPSDLPKWQKLSAKATHIGLYGAMLMMPMSGWLMQNADGRAVNVFGLFSLPQLVNTDINLYAIFRETHGLVAWLFIAMIFMHVGAALYHGLIKQDGVLSSMLRRKK